MDASQNTLCPPDRLAAALQADQGGRLDQITALLADYARDPRLHFLQGSMLASARRYDEARAAMTRAVEMAPDFDVARFQLGLLELSSGFPAAAEATLAPLVTREGETPLLLFARGLQALMREEIAECVELLERGIARNTELPPMNADMQLLVDGAKALLEGADSGALALSGQPEGPTSSAHWLLQQYAAKRTRH